jgi:hypothetical protein
MAVAPDRSLCTVQLLGPGDYQARSENSENKRVFHKSSPLMCAIRTKLRADLRNSPRHGFDETGEGVQLITCPTYSIRICPCKALFAHASADRLRLLGSNVSMIVMT